MKKVFYFLFLLTVFNLHNIEAKTVNLETGNLIFDTSRLVEIDEFDYIYTVKAIHLDGYFIELQDGSVWGIEELSPEAESFYRNTNSSLEIDFVENIVATWQPGEHLIFHKVVDRESILVYNIDRDQLFDVTPLSPAKYEPITVASLNYSKRIIGLSDGSAWYGNACPCAGWKIGDPILIAKDNPWISTHTHMLINLKYCDCEATSGHIHPNRLGVQRMQ